MAPLIVETPENDAFSPSRFSLPLRSHLTQETSCKPPRTRRVRFGKPTVIHQDPGYSCYDTDDATKWWTADDLQKIRQEAKRISGDLRGKGSANPSSCFLTMAHRKTTLMLASDFKNLMRLPRSTPDQDLHQWCSWGDGRRGLERFSSQAFWCFRRKDITSYRGGIVEEYAKQRQAGYHDAEVIGKLAREASRRPRTFALFMGEADALEASSILADAVPVRRAPPRKRSKTEH